jgi:hypothetical protein
MRQKTKNHQNQGSIDKKFDFFPQSLGHIPRWVHLVQKTRAKNSHAWAPLRCKNDKNLSDEKSYTWAPSKATNKFVLFKSILLILITNYLPDC